MPSPGDWLAQHAVGTLSLGEGMQIAPRKLTTHQKAVLIHVLVTFPDQQVGVSYSPSTSDALSYAEDFLTIFNAIGWRVDGGAPQMILDERCAGLTLLVSAEGNAPPSAEAFRDALRIYGIEVAILCDPSSAVRSGEFILAIGRQT